MTTAQPRADSLAVDAQTEAVANAAAATGPASPAMPFDVRRLPLWRLTEVSPSDYHSFEVVSHQTSPRRRHAIRWDVVLDTALLTLVFVITIGGML